MKRKLNLLAQSLENVVLGVAAGLAQPWGKMKLNAEEIAERRRHRLDRGEQSFLWCWQHRGFW